MKILKTAVSRGMALCASFIFANGAVAASDGVADRAFWVDTMVRIVNPVVTNLAAGTLHRNMPRRDVSAFRAFHHLPFRNLPGARARGAPGAGELSREAGGRQVCADRRPRTADGS